MVQMICIVNSYVYIDLALNHSNCFDTKITFLVTSVDIIEPFNVSGNLTIRFRYV